MAGVRDDPKASLPCFHNPRPDPITAKGGRTNTGQKPCPPQTVLLLLAQDGQADPDSPSPLSVRYGVITRSLVILVVKFTKSGS